MSAGKATSVAAFTSPSVWQCISAFVTGWLSASVSTSALDSTSLSVSPSVSAPAFSRLLASMSSNVPGSTLTSVSQTFLALSMLACRPFSVVHCAVCHQVWPNLHLLNSQVAFRNCALAFSLTNVWPTISVSESVSVLVKILTNASASMFLHVSPRFKASASASV